MQKLSFLYPAWSVFKPNTLYILPEYREKMCKNCMDFFECMYFFLFVSNNRCFQLYHNFDSLALCRDPVPVSWQLLPPPLPLPTRLMPSLVLLLLLPLLPPPPPPLPPPPLPAPLLPFRGVAITPVLALTWPKAIAMGLGDESGDCVREDTWKKSKKK